MRTIYETEYLTVKSYDEPRGKPYVDIQTIGNVRLKEWQALQLAITILQQYTPTTEQERGKK